MRKRSIPQQRLLAVKPLLWLALGMAFAPISWAEEPSFIQFSGSGFLTLAAGKIFGGDNTYDASGFNCPCFVTDYAQAGVYEKGDGLTLNPDSKLGLQGKVSFGKDFSITGQIVTRGARDGKTNLEWVYGGYNINDKITVQVGRKRLPIFYYSESQDVGVTFPWVHLPSQAYGWEVVNYNGLNLLYRDQWSDWSSTLNAFAGDEERKSNDFWRLYNGRLSRTDSKWAKILGAELVVSRDWLELRGAYIQSNYQNRVLVDNTGEFIEDAAYNDRYKQKLYAFSANVDYDAWVLRGEYLYLDRKGTNEIDVSKLLAVGYRVGKFLPMLTWSHYKYKVADGDPELPSESHSIIAGSLRYDLTTSSALKIQLERWRDHSTGPIVPAPSQLNKSNLLSISYDLVF